MRPIAALVSAAGLLSAALIAPASAQQAPLKIGVLSDFSSVYSDIGGMGNVEATKMAIEDFGGQMFGKPIDMVSADVLNKPDVASTIARKWWETEGVDMIIDLPTSATALAVMELSKQYEKIMIVTDAASSDITGKSCSLYRALDLRHLRQRPHRRQRQMCIRDSYMVDPETRQIAPDMAHAQQIDSSGTGL